MDIVLAAVRHGGLHAFRQLSERQQCNDDVIFAAVEHEMVASADVVDDYFLVEVLELLNTGLRWSLKEWLVHIKFDRFLYLITDYGERAISPARRRSRWRCW